MRYAGSLILAGLLMVPLLLQAEADSSATRKHRKDLSVLYESLEISDITLKQTAYKGDDLFSPTFKIKNTTSRTLTVPEMPGRPGVSSSALGQATWTIRRIGPTHNKNEANRTISGNQGPVVIPTLAPNADVDIPPPRVPGSPGGQTIAQMNLTSGEYEITFGFGLPNGPQVKPQAARFLVDNPEAKGQRARDNEKKAKAMHMSFDEFVDEIFTATKQGEINLSLRQVKAGAPLEASFLLSKIPGKDLPKRDKENSSFGLKYIMSVYKSGGAGGGSPQQKDFKAAVAGKDLMLDWPAIESLEKNGSLTMTLPIETDGLAAGNYEVSVYVRGVENKEHAPHAVKARFTIFK